MRRKTTNVGHLLALRLCPAYLHWLLTRNKQEPPKEGQIIGRVVHRRAAEGDSQAVIQYQKRQLQMVPVEKRDQVEVDVDELSFHAQELSDEEVTAEEKEVQLFWQDPVTGWTVYAKPDQRFWFEDKLRNKVMQITEVKSQALFAKRYHWDQIFLFGLIAAMAENYEGPIRLVLQFPYVAMLKSQGVKWVKITDANGERLINVDELHSEVERWYSPKMTEEKLEALRADLRLMEECFGSGHFPCPEGDDCWACHTLGEHAPERVQPSVSVVSEEEVVASNVVSLVQDLPCGSGCAESTTRTA